MAKQKSPWIAVLGGVPREWRHATEPVTIYRQDLPTGESRFHAESKGLQIATRESLVGALVAAERWIHDQKVEKSIARPIAKALPSVSIQHESNRDGGSDGELGHRMHR